MRTTKAMLEADLATVRAARDELLEINAALDARVEALCGRNAALEASLRQSIARQEDLSAQIDEARYDLGIALKHLSECRAEAVQLRSINASWAHQAKVDAQTIMRLKAHQPRLPSVTVSSFRERCEQYCAQNNVRCVPASVVREWRNEA